MAQRVAHVFNRGVDKRKVFLDEADYLRFVISLILLNNKEGKMRVVARDIFPLLSEITSKQQKLVEVLRVTLMPNHYHLLLAEVEEGGISEFARRLGNSYTKYFNTRYTGRSGYLFQNKAQIVSVTHGDQMLYLPIYIDLNPAELGFPGWKEDRHRPCGKIASFLKQYRWSSYGDPRGIFAFTNTALLYELIDSTPATYEKELTAMIKEPFGLEAVDLSTWHVDRFRKTAE
jgi:putative transposase